MTILVDSAANLAESGFIPDPVLRFGIRRLVEKRRKQIRPPVEAGESASATDLERFVEMMNRSAVALVPELANEQHYEVPASFFAEVLGKHQKYSCCFWDDGATTLDAAERAALEISCRRAAIDDGMRVLDLGCGWGSLSLWIAETYPSCSVTGVSNSHAQRRHIEAEIARRDLSNLRIITADMNHFDPGQTFDRIVSIEMFEHMRNYRELFRRIAHWLNDDGLFFMHIFCHREAAYEFVDASASDWMSRHFFSGGIMPSQDLPLRFQEHLGLKDRWTWDGNQYRKTAEAWLKNMDSRKDRILPILESTYGQEDAHRWWVRWRLFFLAVSEMFGSHDGREWLVGHYLFEPHKRSAGGAR